MISFEEVSKIFVDLYPQDNEHDIKHHETVFNILKRTLKSKTYNTYIQNFALFCAAIHSIMDGKYESNEDEICKRIVEYTDYNVNDVMNVIKNKIEV